MASALRTKGGTRRWRRIRAAVLIRDDGVCHYCGSKADTVDHVIPRARGGGDEWSNLVASCTPCNRSKGADLNHPLAGPMAVTRGRGLSLDDAGPLGRPVIH